MTDELKKLDADIKTAQEVILRDGVCCDAFIGVIKAAQAHAEMLRGGG